MRDGKHYQRIIQDYDAQLGLTPNEFYRLSIVSGMLAGSLVPDEIEKKLAADFIGDIINDSNSNVRINQAMNMILGKGDIEDPLRTVAMYMIEILFHTRWLTGFKTILEKARTGHQIVMAGGSLTEDQKLTLHEYAFVRDLGALKLIIDKLDQIQLTGSIGELYQGILRCNQTIRDIELKMKIDQARQPFFPIHKQRFFYEKLLNYFAHLADVFVQNKIRPQAPRPELKGLK